MKLELLKRHTVKEDACTLCFDAQACVELKPCNHKGFCMICAHQLESCPMCRGPIERVHEIQIVTIPVNNGSTFEQAKSQQNGTESEQQRILAVSRERS